MDSNIGFKEKNCIENNVNKTKITKKRKCLFFPSCNIFKYIFEKSENFRDKGRMLKKIFLR